MGHWLEGAVSKAAKSRQLLVHGICRHPDIQKAYHDSKQPTVRISQRWDINSGKFVNEIGF